MQFNVRTPLFGTYMIFLFQTRGLRTIFRISTGSPRSRLYIWGVFTPMRWGRLHNALGHDEEPTHMRWVEFSVIVVWRRGMASGRLASTRNVFNRCHLTKRKRCCAVNVADLFDVAAASRLDHVRRRCRKACRSAAAALQAALRGFGVRRGVPNVVRLRAQAAARRQVDAHLARSRAVLVLQRVARGR